MKYYKKGIIDPIETIGVILIISILIISMTLILFKANTIIIDEKETKLQLSINKILEGRCFAEEFGVINYNNFNQNKLDECFANADDTYSGRIYILNLSNEEQLLTNYIYLNGENNFNTKVPLCHTRNKNMLCKELRYPIVFTEADYKNIHTLVIELIIQ